MTDHIFYYISEVLLQYFRTSAIGEGERFQIRYEQQELVKSQYDILQQTAQELGFTVDPFEFKDYTSYQISFAGYRLIVAASTTGIAEDFLTGLRNRTGNPALSQFAGTTILFIHHTSLDSIVGGCKSLADAGMPLSSAYIKANIADRIASDDHFQNFEKAVLSFRLDQVGQGNEDSYSLFDYSVYLEILGKKSLAKEDYRKLNLFTDKSLKDQQDPQETRKRLEQNDEWFEDIHQAHQYGNTEKHLEKTFGTKGVTALVQGDWMDRDFTDIERFADEKDKIQQIEYKPDLRGITEDLLSCWDMPEGSTAAKQRIRHLIVFNPEHRHSALLHLAFDGNPKKEGFVSERINIKDTELTVKDKRIIWQIELSDPSSAAFKRFTYIHPGSSARHVFQLLVLPFAAALLGNWKQNYTLQVKHKDWWISLASQDEYLLNDGQPRSRTEVLTAGTTYDLEADQTLYLKLKANADELEQEELPFTLQVDGLTLPVRVTIPTEKPVFISGKDIWSRKIKGAPSMEYVSTPDASKDKEVVTLLQGTSRYYPPKDEFRINLALEKQLIDGGHMAYFEDRNKRLLPNEDVAVDGSVAKAYLELVDWFRQREMLPSLTSPDDSLLALYRALVHAYIQALNEIPEGQALSAAARQLLRVGAVEMLEEERLLKLSPLHPLNIAYQLRVRQAVGSDMEIADYLLEKLRPLNLVPFIKGRRRTNSSGHYYYQPLEQEHSAEWLYYFCDELSPQQITRHFVPELTREKIEQFLRHFRYLFLGEKSCLKINLFNQGDAREILLGILQFYARYLRKEQSNADSAPSIEVRIYGSARYLTRFEEITLYDDLASVQEAFKFQFQQLTDPDELLSLYHRKVTFFKPEEEPAAYAYGHLSFYQFAPSEVSKSYNNMTQVPTGVSLGGLMADVPSVFQADAFRTGFGSEGLTADNELLDLVRVANAYVNVTHSDDQFNRQHAMAFVISKATNTAIEAVYQSSQWVTFIEPKVDLSFFKSYKDVVIIHYSDQYNNASGYDAITITGKWQPYKVAIQEVFLEQTLTLADHQVIPIISLFNAVNGNWLLSLNSLHRNNPYHRLEKLSLLSAVKAALAILDHPDIIWVPVAMEEILRVSGAVGLRMGEGLFSVKNLGESGEHSDDLLMIGLEELDGELHMHLYPIEVKIGNIEQPIVHKAKSQGRKTVHLLRKYVAENQGLSGKIYRNFFAKLVLVSAEKCALYDIWPAYQQRWTQVKQYRPSLLQDAFQVSTALDRAINQFGVMIFKWSTSYLSRSILYEDDAALITLLKADGLAYLKADLAQLSDDFQNGNVSPISPGQLLSQRYPLPDPAPAAQIPPTPEQASEIVPAPDLTPLASEEGDMASAPAIEPLIFNRLSRADIERAYQSVYDKLNSIGVTITKQLPADLVYLEGPAFYRLLLIPAASTTIKKIRGVIEELNIALHLREGENVRVFSDLGNVWLEIPKPDDLKVKVTTTHIWQQFERNEEFRIPFGTNIEGQVQSINFSSSNSPHLLLAGTTGSGKSVVLDTLLRGAVRFYTPEELRLFLIDPKGNELIDFQRFPQTGAPNGRTSAEAIALLNQAVEEMENRYTRFAEIWASTGRAAKDLIEYNRIVPETERLPRWLVVLDEYSDLLDEDSQNKTMIEMLLKRLAQKARAAGIHVIVATQKPLVTIVSSAIKSNLPGVIALRVRTAVDSRVILDDQGAETLAGRGDALFKNGTGQMVRVQVAIYE